MALDLLNPRVENLISYRHLILLFLHRHLMFVQIVIFYEIFVNKIVYAALWEMTHFPSYSLFPQGRNVARSSLFVSVPQSMKECQAT